VTRSRPSRASSRGDTQPATVTKIDPDSSPILTLVISGRRTQKEISLIAQKQIKEVLETVQDVGEVAFQSYRQREIQVLVNPNRLNAYGLTTGPGPHGRGAAERGVARRQLHLGADGLLDADDGSPARRARLRTRSCSPTRTARWCGSRTSRASATTVEEVRSSTASTAKTPCRCRLRKHRARTPLPWSTVSSRASIGSRWRCPPTSRSSPSGNQSRFIRKSFEESSVTSCSAAILAALVVLLFIRNFRVTVIAALAIPTSIIGTFTVMKALGFTLNNMTMLALSLATGIVIDDAIVVLENIFRYIEEKEVTPFEAA